MGGILAGVTTMLQAIATAFGGTFGIAVVTVGLGGTAIGCILFHLPLHWLWKAAVVSVILLGAGAIAQALVT